MTDIIAIRGAGTLPGEDIVEPLLSTEAIALFRARNELDASATAMSERQLEVVYQPGLEPGNLVMIIDSAQGRMYKGMLTEVQHDIQADPLSASTRITVEVPTEFYR